VASHAVKSMVVGLHNDEAVRVNIKGSWHNQKVIKCSGPMCLGS
jgi:hypothetical protein